MNKLQELSDAFQLQYEKFVNGCAAVEEEGLWNEAQYGDMETYYYNDIMCVILCLISADGIFSETEADYINEIFGFRYSAAELREMYGTEGDSIRSMLVNEVPAGYRRLKSINKKLSVHYRDMLLIVCDIIAESDGIVNPAESGEIQALRAALKD